MITNSAAVRMVAETKFGVLGESDVSFRRRFLATFGCNVSTVAQLWNDVDVNVQQLNNTHVIWFLTSLCFLRTHPTMEGLATRPQKDKKTVRKHVWAFTQCLSRLEMVSAKLEHMCWFPDHRYLPLTPDLKRKLHRRAERIRSRLQFLHTERDDVRERLTSWTDCCSDDETPSIPTVAAQPNSDNGAKDCVGEPAP